MEREVMKEGASYFLIKPFDYDILAESYHPDVVLLEVGIGLEK